MVTSHSSRECSAARTHPRFAPRLVIAMLIESTEYFQASDGIAIRRGPNEVTESDYERLPVATRTKLRILQEHGVVRLHPLATAKRSG